MISIPEMRSIGKWFLQGPSFLMLVDPSGQIGNRVFDKIYGLTVIDDDGQSVSFFERKGYCLLRTAKWMKAIDLQRIRSEEFTNLSVSLEYAQLKLQLDKIEPLLQGLQEQIQENVAGHNAFMAGTERLGLQLMQFTCLGSGTTENSWLVAINDQGMMPWQLFEENLSELDRCQLPGVEIEEGYFFDPFSDLETYSPEDLVSLPSRFFEQDSETEDSV